MSGSQQKQEGQQQQASQSLVQFEGYTGLNTQPSRYGIGDKECYVYDGFFPAGNDNARVIPDNGPLVATFNNSAVAYYDFANIGATPYAIVFSADGGVWSVNTTTGVATVIAGAGTIQNPGTGNTAISQWGSQFVLIVSTQADGYFIWDGTTFYRAGDAVPGFTTVPFGVSGNGIETFQSHVWIINGDSLIFSAPASITDFSTASGGGSLTSNESSLRVRYTQLRQSNGYLYLFGDSSISYIAGVQTTGTPPTTTFTLQVVDPEVGTAWPDTVDVLGSNIVFANAWGGHVSFGGRSAKISPELDGIYNSVPNFGGQTPSAAKAILFGRRVWVLLLPVIDQITFQQVNKLFLWDEKHWCSAQQSISLVFVQHQEIDSVLTAWGTDGIGLYRLFQTPSTALTRTLRSKFWAPDLSYAEIKAENRFWGIIRFYSGGASTITISIDSEKGSSPKTIAIAPPVVVWTNNVGVVAVWRNNAAQLSTWSTAGGGDADGIVVLGPNSCGQQGALVGITISTNAADIAIISMATMPVPVQYRG